MDIRTFYSLDEIEKPEQNPSVEKAANQVSSKGEQQAPKDEYIRSEQESKPSGLYYVEKDGNGKHNIRYEDPKKASESKTTTNTNQVDQEIKQLKAEQKRLKQQLNAAAGDESKSRKIKQKLAQTERMLKFKDNDSYRRSHASVSSQ